MSDNTFNGWSNYETWVVSLWLLNDEPLYNWCIRLVRKHRIDDVQLPDGLHATGSPKIFNIETMSVELELWAQQNKVVESLPEAEPINPSLVNWREIAEAFAESA